MTRIRLVLTLSAALCAPAITHAQTPDFSGIWVLDPSRSVLPVAPVSVGGDIRPPTKIKNVRPVYPVDAQRDRITGAVMIQATIDTDGSVANAEVVGSIPALDQAALDAVTQWKFTPTTLKGTPVPVIMIVTVNFSLDGVKPAPGAFTPPVGAPGVRMPPGATTGSTTRPTAPMGPASRVTITQTPETLTVTHETPRGPLVTLYRLDGSESRNAVTVTVYRLDASESRNAVTVAARAGGAAPAEVEFVYRSRWDSGRLITTITGSPGGLGPQQRTQTIYLDGDTMVIETAGPGLAGSDPVVQKLVYRKSGGV